MEKLQLELKHFYFFCWKNVFEKRKRVSTNQVSLKSDLEGTIIISVNHKLEIQLVLFGDCNEKLYNSRTQKLPLLYSKNTLNILA